MEPNYDRLDPEERYNKILALTSAVLGMASICGALIPIVGIIGSTLGIIAGYFGRKSESQKLANFGILMSSFALTLSLTYGFFVYISNPK